MDINVRIKRLQLNISGDNEFYKKQSKDKDEGEFSDDPPNEIKINSTLHRNTLLSISDENLLGAKENLNRNKKP